MKSYCTNGKALRKAIEKEWETKQNEFFEQCKYDIAAQIIAVCMLTLKTRFGFGKSRMNDFYNDLKGTLNVNSILGKSFSTVDCIELIKKLYDIDLDKGFK